MLRERPFWTCGETSEGHHAYAQNSVHKCLCPRHRHFPKKYGIIREYEDETGDRWITALARRAQRGGLWFTVSNPSTSALIAFLTCTNSGSKCNNFYEPKLQLKSRPCTVIVDVGHGRLFFCSVHVFQTSPNARASFAKQNSVNDTKTALNTRTGSPSLACTLTSITTTTFLSFHKSFLSATVSTTHSARAGPAREKSSIKNGGDAVAIAAGN